MRQAIILLFLCLTHCAPPPFLNYVEEENIPHDQDQKISPCWIMTADLNLCGIPEWITGRPNTKTENQLKILFKPLDPQRQFVPIHNFSFRLWMPSMNHGSVSTKIEWIAPDTVLVKNIYFIMPGQWQLQMQINDEIDLNQELSL